MTGLTARTAGFTLLEIILVLVVLAMLAYVAIAALAGALAGARVQENATRMAAMLRGARAEAAGQGRRVQLTFDAATRQPVLSIELDGLGQPGVFTPLQKWWVAQSALAEGVQATQCELTGDSAFIQASAAAHSADKPDGASLSSIMFYPDGASDSARLVLTSPDAEHPWSVEILLNGVDGSIQVNRLEGQP